MGKYDTLFEKIISNEQFADELGIYAGRTKTITEGKKSVNKKVKAIAEVLSEIGAKIDAVKTDGKSLKDNVNFDNAEMQGIYRKIVSLLTK